MDENDEVLNDEIINTEPDNTETDNTETGDNVDETPEIDNNSLIARLERALLARDIELPSQETMKDEISNATNAINERRKVAYDTEILPTHEHILIELCIEAISKYGAEGETSHSENGIGRNYDNASPYSQATLNKIIPRIGVC